MTSTTTTTAVEHDKKIVQALAALLVAMFRTSEARKPAA